MASAPPTSNETSSPSNSESESERESESDAESDSCDGTETMDSLSSFDQSEEEDHLSSEDIIEEPASGPLLCEFEVEEEKPSGVEATDESSSDLERSGEGQPRTNYPPSLLSPPHFFLLLLLLLLSLSFSFSLNYISAFRHFLFYNKEGFCCCF